MRCMSISRASQNKEKLVPEQCLLAEPVAETLPSSHADEIPEATNHILMSAHGLLRSSQCTSSKSASARPDAATDAHLNVGSCGKPV